MTKEGRSRMKVKVPFLWRVLSISSMLSLGMFIFYLIFKKSGGKFPLAAGDSTDPYFFGAVFAVLIPVIVYILIIDKTLKGIVIKRSGKDIALDVASDVAKAAAVTAVGGSSGGSRSSSSSGTKGGGGDFGGGGSTGGY